MSKNSSEISFFVIWGWLFPDFRDLDADSRCVIGLFKELEQTILKPGRFSTLVVRSDRKADLIRILDVLRI